MFTPSYIKLFQSGELSIRARKLESLLADCNICPKDCKVNRINNEIAACYSGYNPVVSSYCVHYGEEPVLVGSKDNDNENGVGNIFFGNCNLRCVYCQNYEISQNHKVEIKNEVLIERTMPEIPNVFGIDSLSANEYQLMKCWINQGYPEN